MWRLLLVWLIWLMETRQQQHSSCLSAVVQRAHMRMHRPLAFATSARLLRLLAAFPALSASPPSASSLSPATDLCNAALGPHYRGLVYCSCWMRLATKS